MTYEMSKENKAYLGDAAKKLEEHFNNREKEINEIAKIFPDTYNDLIRFNNKDWKNINNICKDAINNKLSSAEFLITIQNEIKELLSGFVSKILEDYSYKDSTKIKSIADNIGQIPLGLIDDTKKAFINKSKM